MVDISDKGAENHYFRKRAVRLYAISAALLSAILFSLAFALDFEPDKCHFENGSVLGALAFYGSLVLCAAALILPFAVIPKEKPTESVFPEGNKYLYYYTLDSSFIKILRACVFAVLLLQGVFRAVLVITGAEKTALSAPLSYAMLLLVLPLALYFIPEVTEKIKKANGKAHIVCGCLGLLWFLLNILNTYYDKSVSLASKYVTVTQLCFITLMLALVYEMRYHLDGTMVRARLATSCASFVLGFGFGFGQIVMLVTVGQISFGATAGAISILALSVYFGAKLFFYEED